jgi:hypothetical protein
MTTDQPTVVLPEAELMTAAETELAATVARNDDIPETAMGEYPEYWIG